MSVNASLLLYTMTQEKGLYQAALPNSALVDATL
jgi:hypothetical protein